MKKLNSKIDNKVAAGDSPFIEGFFRGTFTLTISLFLLTIASTLMLTNCDRGNCVVPNEDKKEDKKTEDPTVTITTNTVLKYKSTIAGGALGSSQLELQ